MKSGNHRAILRPLYPGSGRGLTPRPRDRLRAGKSIRRWGLRFSVNCDFDDGNGVIVGGYDGDGDSQPILQLNIINAERREMSPLRISLKVRNCRRLTPVELQNLDNCDYNEKDEGKL